jgi:hypothetical protein
MKSSFNSSSAIKQKRDSPPNALDTLNNKMTNNDIYNRAQKVRTEYEANLSKRYIVNKTDRYKNGLMANSGARLPVYNSQNASPRESPSSPTSSTGSLRTVTAAAPDIGPNSSGLPSRAPPPPASNHQQAGSTSGKAITTTTFHTYRQFKEQQKLAAMQQRDASLPPAAHHNGSNGLPPAGMSKPDVVIKPYSERNQGGVMPRAGAPPEGSPPSPPTQYKSYVYKTASGAARTAIPTSSRSYNSIGTSSVYRGQQPAAAYTGAADRIQPGVGPSDLSKG